MRLKTILGDRPVLVITRVHENPAGVDFVIVHAGMPKGERIRLAGFLSLQEALERFAEVKAKYDLKV